MLEQKNRNLGNWLCLALFFMMVLVLAACSGGNDSVIDDPVALRPTAVPEINQATSFQGPLAKPGQNSVSRFIKNGIYSATFNYNGQYVDELSVPTASADIANGNFSTTTTQESGVDEADRIEYDGDTLFLAAFPQWLDETDYQSKVRVLARQSDDSLTEVAELPIVDDNANIDGLYQNNNYLAVLSTNFPMYTLDTFAPQPWTPTQEKLTLDIYDTTTPASPLIVTNIQIEGSMLSSRRIDDQLYIVTSYTAYVEGLNTSASTDEELLANYLTILDTPDADLMPKIYQNGDQGSPLNQVQDCAIPAQASDNDGYAHLLTVIRINMDDPSDFEASCISAVAEVMYMSTDNIYLTSTLDNQTLVHKISLDANLTYQASGAIDGVIGWRGGAKLRLSEQNNILRIVSSDYSSGEPVHKLSVMQQQANELDVIATLPNEIFPESIGKPGEDIYAVRFLGDRGYIVTFERIDPLYVLDLANPNQPRVLGALEIPGFSSYLHPLDNGYLLGVGQQVNARNIPENGQDTDEAVIEEGMKVSLFDVSDPTAPRELGSLVTANSYTPVEYDYRALSVLNSDGSYQFALPIESWNRQNDIALDVWSSSHSLLLLEVNTNDAAPELVKRREVPASNSDQGYVYGGEDRSVIHGNNVYYIHGNQVWLTTWEDNAPILGPY